MKVLVLTIAIIALALFGLALRIIFIKGGEFRGSCASNNPMLKNEIGECTVCGAKPEEECKS
jgi:hypothetical protein